MDKVIERMKQRVNDLNRRIEQLRENPTDFNVGLATSKESEVTALESLIKQMEVERRVYYGLSESEFRQIFKSDRTAI